MSSPTEPLPPESSLSPRWVLMESPLAAATSWVRVRRRQRERPVTRGRRWVALFGTFVLHLVFLAIFVLGPPYDWKPPPDRPAQYLQVRLIDAAELLPPPPAVHGTPPKQIGPRHQGRTAAAARQAAKATPAAPGRASASEALARVAAQPARAPTPQSAAAPPPPVSLPVPAPTPEMQPVPLAGQPPSVAVPISSLQPPVPPKFQPKPVRAVQVDGTQPVLPPASLALPEVPTQMPPPLVTPSIALSAELPRLNTPASVSALRAPAASAPPAPDMQPVPLPAQTAPTVNLQAQLNVPAPAAPRDLPQVQAPAAQVADAQLEAIPVATTSAVRVATQPADAKLDVKDAAAPSVQAVTHVVAAAPAPPAPMVAAAPVAAVAETTPSSATAVAAQNTANAEQAGAASTTGNERDVSTAPDATPQGRDDAVLGQSTAAVASVPGASAAGQATGSQQGKLSADHGSGAGKLAGQLGGNRPGAAQGERNGTPGAYTQLQPRGDTNVMNHSTPNIGYKPTRFEGDWTPYGESSVDTALRRAVEKTSIEHTFHLPRGIRFKCVVMPLVPTSLFGCGGADPPPVPVATKVYDPLHLAPANPVAAPSPVAATAAAATPSIKLDNTVECATARVSGGPLPPGCATAGSAPLPVRTPVSASSTWVPASDQFH